MRVLLLFPVLFIAFASCEDCSKKQVDCPAFKDSLYKVWFDYAENQQLVFMSDSATYDTLKVTRVHLSEAFRTTVSAVNSGCYSDASVVFANSDTTNTLIQSLGYNVIDNQYNNSSQNSLSFYFGKNSLYRGAVSDTGTQYYPNDSYNVVSRFFPSAIVGNKTFSNIQELVIDTTSVKNVFKEKGIFKVWIAKGTGIAAFEQYHGKLWVKQ